MILFYEKKIGNVQDLIPMLEKVLALGRPFIIVAEDVENECLATLVLNRIRAEPPVAAVKAPGFGDRRKAMLEDMAILTGGQFISDDLGLKLENVGPGNARHVRRLVITKENTTIVGGKGDKAAIAGRSDADQAPDREHRQQLRQGEAAGAAGQAERRRRRRQGRRSHRDRAQGEESPRRGRARCHARRARRGHRPRRRRRARHGGQGPRHGHGEVPGTRRSA